MQAGRANEYLQFRKAETLSEISRDEIWKVNNYGIAKRISVGEIER